MNPAVLEQLKAITGPAGWLTGAHDVAPYVRDWRNKWSGAAPIVMRPATVEEVAAIVSTCADAEIGIVPQAGNTGLVGGGIPDNSGQEVILSVNRMTRVRAIDPQNNTITVEAGCILQDVQEAARGAGRLYPLSLAAEGSCRIGGTLSTNAGGTNVLRYGNARDHVLGLEVVLADGRVWNGLRGLRKDNTGYDLKQLFLGTEGTLGIITAAVLKLWPLPRDEVTAWLGLAGPREALAMLQRLQDGTGGQVTGFEYMAASALEMTFSQLPANRSPFSKEHPACVLMEAASSTPDGDLRRVVEDELAKGLDEGLLADAIIAESTAQARAFWQIREDMPQAQTMMSGSISHDVAVPAGSIADYLDQVSEQIAARVPEARIIPYGHLGDGNMHVNLCAVSPADGAALLSRADDVNDIVESLAVAFGGSFSAEHGVGRLRMRQMDAYKDATELGLMATLKRSLDPANTLNPGKVIAPDRLE